MQPNKLIAMWQQDRTAFNAWLTIPCAWTAEVITHLGFDAVTIDMQHGLPDYQTTLSMLQAISTTDAVPLVRIPWNEPGIMMRMLDAGALGIICPMINTRQQAQSFVDACRYPPQGYRSYGPIRAELYAGNDYLTHANKEVIRFAMIETVTALENLDEILEVEGLDGVYAGTFDLSVSMGLSDLGNLENPQLNQALNRILAATSRTGRVAGIHARTPESAVVLSQWGFRLITPVNDTNVLRVAAQKALEQARKGIT